jgi:hypothetical protein
MSSASNAARGREDGAAAGNGRKHTAGAYDVRTVIAALIGFYGIVLTIMGLVSDNADDRTKTGDVNANLWAGIVMIAVAVAFAVWLRLRPVVVDPKLLAAEKAEGTSNGSGVAPH